MDVENIDPKGNPSATSATVLHNKQEGFSVKSSSKNKPEETVRNKHVDNLKKMETIETIDPLYTDFVNMPGLNDKCFYNLPYKSDDFKLN